MTRSRNLSTKISHDIAINKLAMGNNGDFNALLYTWMIPHTKDNGILYGDPEEILYTVMPARRDKTPEDIAAALKAIESVKMEVPGDDGMQKVSLIKWDKKNNRVIFPAKQYYKYQNRIPVERRRDDSTPFDGVVSGNFPEDAEEDHEIPQYAATSIAGKDSISVEELNKVKIEEVLKILPTRKSPNAQQIVHDAVCRYPYVPLEIVVQCMRMVFDKFNTPQHKNRKDWASLFAKQLEWQAHNYIPDMPDDAQTYDEWEEQYSSIKEKAQREAATLLQGAAK